MEHQEGQKEVLTLPGSHLRPSVSVSSYRAKRGAETNTADSRGRPKVRQQGYHVTSFEHRNNYGAQQLVNNNNVQHCNPTFFETQDTFPIKGRVRIEHNRNRPTCLGEFSSTTIEKSNGIPGANNLGHKQVLGTSKGVNSEAVSLIAPENSEVLTGNNVLESSFLSSDTGGKVSRSTGPNKASDHTDTRGFPKTADSTIVEELRKGTTSTSDAVSFTLRRRQDDATETHRRWEHLKDQVFRRQVQPIRKSNVEVHPDQRYIPQEGSPRQGEGDQVPLNREKDQTDSHRRHLALLSENGSYGIEREVQPRSDHTSLRTQLGSIESNRGDQEIRRSITQVNGESQANQDEQIPAPKVHSVGLDLLFPVHSKHTGFDFYAPLNTMAPFYSSPFTILPPTAPSPLATHTLQQRTPFTPITGLALKRTPTQRIDVQLALNSPHFEEFKPAYNQLFNVRTFVESIIQPQFLSKKPVFSRHLLRHLPTMIEDDIAETCNIDELLDISLWFGIAADTVEFRLVENLKRLRQAFTPTITMLLDSIHDFARGLLGVKGAYIWQEDAKSYFYTFEIPQLIRNYFGALLTNERGDYVAVRLKVMSQGFFKSPSTAQRFSLGLCREALLNSGEAYLAPWLDNFLGRAETFQSATELRQQLRDTCAHYGVTVKPTTEEPSQSLDALGIHFDTNTQTLCMAKSFMDNFDTFVQSSDIQHLSRRQFLQLTGRILWSFYVLRVSAAFFPQVMAVMADICSALGSNIVNSKAFWEGKLNLPANTIAELREMIEVVKENYPLHYNTITLAPEEAIWAWTDASSYLGAWVVEPFADSEETWSTLGFDDALQNIPIFYKEIYMSAIVVDHLCNIYRDQQILLLGDNQAALFAIMKGHSMNPATNGIIRWMYQRSREANNTLFVSWVSTLLMRADALTRMSARPGPPHPITLDTSLPRRGIQAAN